MFQMPHLNLARGIPHPGNRCARKIDGVAVEVQHHLHHIGIHDVARSLDRRCYRADRSLRLLQQGIDRHINRVRIEQRFISLDVYENVSLFASRYFRDAFRPSAVLAPRHSCLTAKASMAFTMRSSSVATITRFTRAASLARSYTR